MINERRNYLILSAAFLSFMLSVYLWFSGQTNEGIFTSIWVPSIITFGIFINLVARRK